MGLASALLWGAAGLVNGRVARAESAPLAVAWALLTGFVVAATLAVASSGVPGEATSADWAWALTASVATLGGLLLSYESYRRGKLGVVAPIVATQGAIAAVIAVLAGDPLALGAGVMLVVIVVGVVLASKPEAMPEDTPPVPRRTSLVAPAVALAGALSFGVGLFSASRVSDDLSAFWLALMPRATGLVLLVIPLLLLRGLRVPRPLWPLVAVGRHARGRGAHRLRRRRPRQRRHRGGDELAVRDRDGGRRRRAVARVPHPRPDRRHRRRGPRRRRPGDRAELTSAPRSVINNVPPRRPQPHQPAWDTPRRLRPESLASTGSHSRTGAGSSSTTL